MNSSVDLPPRDTQFRFRARLRSNIGHRSTVTCRSANSCSHVHTIHLNAVFKCANSEGAVAAQPQASTALAIVNHLQPILFQGLAKSEVELVVTAAVQRKFEPSAILSREGEPADQFFMLITGRARYFTLTENGRRVLLRWIMPSEVIGTMALMHDPDMYLVSAESVTDTELLVWNRAEIRKLAVRYPRLLENALKATKDYFRWYLTAHLALISHSAPQRLARVLSQLAKDIGHPVQEGIELDVTNDELADAAHITRFSTSRLINNWRRKGVLKKSRGKLVLASTEHLLG